MVKLAPLRHTISLPHAPLFTLNCSAAINTAYLALLFETSCYRKVMAKLPLFPLPETVVFPGMTLPLYIFEERYKRMVKDCVESNQQRLVIVLAKERAKASEMSDPLDDIILPITYDVGTYVDILSVSENPDGSYNILTHGQERCRVELADQLAVSEADGSTSYLLYSEDKPEALGRDDPNVERVSAWDTLDTFRTYAQTFFAFDALKQIEEALPDDLLYQASFICANLRVPAHERQEMLETSSLVARFELAQQLMQKHLEAHDADKV